MDVLDLLMFFLESALMGFGLAAGAWVFERMSSPPDPPFQLVPDDDEEEEEPKVKGKRRKDKIRVVRWTA
jgi:hypothetical protein